MGLRPGPSSRPHVKQSWTSSERENTNLWSEPEASISTSQSPTKPKHQWAQSTRIKTHLFEMASKFSFLFGLLLLLQIGQSGQYNLVRWGNPGTNVSANSHHSLLFGSHTSLFGFCLYVWGNTWCPSHFCTTSNINAHQSNVWACALDFRENDFLNNSNCLKRFFF